MGSDKLNAHPGESNADYKVKNLLGTITPGETNEQKVLRMVEKLYDERDTQETLMKKANQLISFQPSFMGLQLNVNKLVEKVFRKKKKK
ncbi:MAG: hypothetical protein GY940_40615 [bacterium]|nr:hypothetical protein [bacterium]